MDIINDQSTPRAKLIQQELSIHPTHSPPPTNMVTDQHKLHIVTYPNENHVATESFLSLFSFSAHSQARRNMYDSQESYENLDHLPTSEQPRL